MTLVPERREELTTEGGLDVTASSRKLAEIAAKLKGGGIRVSLFVDADLDQVKESLRVGAQAVEIHTGRYANASASDDVRAELERVADAVSLAAKIGLEPLAGHGLDYRNIGSARAHPGHRGGQHRPRDHGAERCWWGWRRR